MNPAAFFAAAQLISTEMQFLPTSARDVSLIIVSVVSKC